MRKGKVRSHEEEILGKNVQEGLRKEKKPFCKRSSNLEIKIENNKGR